MVCLLKIVIFHGYVSHNQMVYDVMFLNYSWNAGQVSPGKPPSGRCRPTLSRFKMYVFALFFSSCFQNVLLPCMFHSCLPKIVQVQIWRNISSLPDRDTTYGINPIVIRPCCQGFANFLRRHRRIFSSRFPRCIANRSLLMIRQNQAEDCIVVYCMEATMNGLQICICDQPTLGWYIIIMPYKFGLFGAGLRPPHLHSSCVRMTIYALVFRSCSNL